MTLNFRDKNVIDEILGKANLDPNNDNLVAILKQHESIMSIPNVGSKYFFEFLINLLCFYPNLLNLNYQLAELEKKQIESLVARLLEEKGQDIKSYLEKLKKEEVSILNKIKILNEEKKQGVNPNREKGDP